MAGDSTQDIEMDVDGAAVFFDVMPIVVSVQDAFGGLSVPMARQTASRQATLTAIPPE